MKYYDHKHMNGINVRRILTKEPRRPWQRFVLEFWAFVACIVALALLFAAMAP